MRRGRTEVAAWLVAVATVVGCGSDAAAPPTTSTITVAPTVAATTVSASTIAPTSGAPAVSIELAETFAQIDDALPDLLATTDSSTHVIELRLRTLEVTVDGGQVCLGGGVAAAGSPSCASVAEGPGVLVYSDASPTTPVYAVLTAEQVTVEFDSPGGSLTCFSETASRVGPLAVSWCEDRFPPTIRFSTPEGRILQASIG